MKTKFKGFPLIEIPEGTPTIGFLERDFGREFLKEYQGRVGRDYRGNSTLTVLSQQGDRVVGSNSYAVVLANQILAEQGLRTVNQSDLERALKFGVLSLEGEYVNTSLVLNHSYQKHYIAKQLVGQLKARDQKIKYPLLVNLSDLSLKVDPDSNYGLSFVLREDANPIYAPILNSPNMSRFDSEDIDESTGLPKQTKKEGSRSLNVRNNGFLVDEIGFGGLCLDWDLGLISDRRNLTESAESGLVVVINNKP